jgi:DNA-binding MarR family transcriptional regulator
VSKLADRIWNRLVAAVMDSRGDYRRRAADVTGLPFGRVRALRRLADGPLALHELAEAMSCDAPAATVAVNDLEQRGLALREPHPTNRRVKRVSLTTDGRAVLARLRALTETAPPALQALSAEELEVLGRVVDRLGG